MAADLTSQYPVYLGFWINWSRGRIMGSTLTLTRGDGDLLIAFTAFFVAFVSTRFWRIICFISHISYSSTNPRDTIYHQRQAILRNASSPEEGFRSFMQLCLACRRSLHRFQVLPMALTAAFCVGAFTIAGGFSSRIASVAGNEVLIASMNCGTPDSGLSPDVTGYYTTLEYYSGRIDNAANYAQQCYANNSIGSLGCEAFVTKRLPGSKIEANASCPFSPEMCRKTQSNLRLDTGYIDSHNDLGLNAPPDQRILWRNVLHCAPLVTTGFTSQHTTYLRNTTRYHYGNFSVGDGAGERDYMHTAADIEFQYNQDDPLLAGEYSNLGLDMFATAIKNKTFYEWASTFRPIDAIFRDDADIEVVFLSGNGVRFQNAADDVWYNIDPQPFEDEFGSFYWPREPASPLGCAEQHQFCSTAFQGTSGCGPLASLRDAIAGVAPFFETSYEDFENEIARTAAGARLSYFTDTFFSWDRQLGGVLSQKGPAALQSQRSIMSGFQGPLPPNQWQLDVINWWNILRASAQAAPVHAAFGPTDLDTLQWRINYTTPELQKLCENQKVRSTAYTSFTAFGIFFTFVTGILVALISYMLEPISSFLYKKGYKTHAHLEWTVNSTMQLQRLAHEGIGLGTWSRGTKEIPITEPNELLGCLDIRNLEHPILKQPLRKNSSTPTRTLTETNQSNSSGTTEIKKLVSEDTTKVEKIF